MSGMSHALSLIFECACLVKTLPACTSCVLLYSFLLLVSL